MKAPLLTAMTLSLAACSGGPADKSAVASRADAVRPTEQGPALTRRDVMRGQSEATIEAKLRARAGLAPVAKAEQATPPTLVAAAIKRGGRAVDLSDPFIPGVDDAPQGTLK